MIPGARIVRTNRELECPELDAELREGGATLVLLSDAIEEAELAREVREADLLLVCYTPVTRRVIDGATRLRGIVKYGVGIDAIDVSAARGRGIPVVNVPDYAEDTVAEGAFALLLALAKKIVPIDRAMHARGWLWPTHPWLGADVANKTVGLVGLGRIGRRMARMAAGFRARVIAYDPNVSGEEMAASGVERCDDLSDVIAQSDFLSIHAVLTPETRHLIGAAQLRAMKPTAFLINVARGAIVDEEALLCALDEGRIAGAGLDVYSAEPLRLSEHPLSRLFGLPNVILLPHLTFYTKEAMQRLDRETLARCRELLAGEPTLVKSRDPRLRAQSTGVRFID